MIGSVGQCDSFDTGVKGCMMKRISHAVVAALILATAPASAEPPPDRRSGESPTVALAPILVDQAPDGSRIWAYSGGTDTWDTYKVPEGFKAYAYSHSSVAAVYVTGDEIREIAAFCGRNGTWSRQALREPA